MTSRQRSKHFYRYIMVGLLKIRIKKTLKDDQKKKKIVKKKKDHILEIDFSKETMKDTSNGIQ